MEQIRRQYGVPAKRGGRVKFTGNMGPHPMYGTIKGSRDGHLLVLMDGEWRTRRLHPTWEVEYLGVERAP